MLFNFKVNFQLIVLQNVLNITILFEDMQIWFDGKCYDLLSLIGHIAYEVQIYLKQSTKNYMA